jgi:hypothetical protein
MAPQDCLETKPTGLRRTQPGCDAFISQASMSLDQPKTLAWDELRSSRSALTRLLLTARSARADADPGSFSPQKRRRAESGRRKRHFFSGLVEEQHSRPRSCLSSWAGVSQASGRPPQPGEQSAWINQLAVAAELNASRAE